MNVPLTISRPHLDDVFSTRAEPVELTYVDRGCLDERLAAADRARKHVAIHGESKHGKTWLRSKLLVDETCARTQCTPGMTAEEILSSALGRMGVNERVKLTGTESSETSLGATGRVGSRGTYAQLEAETKEGASSSVEERPVGQDAKDLGWVAEQFRERERRPVFEDFHNLSPEEQKTMAFAIKALGDWDVPCMVAGIWPDQPLLTYYNGELDGRIEDLHLRWTGDELGEVVRKGTRALRVEIADPLVRKLVRDSFTSAGLLQELTRDFLWEAGIRRRGLRKARIDDEDLYRASRARVAKRIAARFDPFVDNLYRHQPDEVAEGAYGSLLWAVTERLGDRELIEGVKVGALIDELTIVAPATTRETIMPVLERLPEAHRVNEVHPAVIAYDRPGDRLVLVDRRFLLYRRRYSRAWPWG